MERIETIAQILEGFDKAGYVANEELATVLFLMLKLQKPLLLEGHPGVGKTDVATRLSAFLDAELIRLQCYEGLDVHSAVYEWNYQKQLLNIKIQEGRGQSAKALEQHIFGDDYLLKRPLLQSITAKDAPPVLLIDEIDRADEEFEAFLLELLSDFQISIPEMGKIQATHKPFVVLTSNRTRELSDALKRRCLYHWIDYPNMKKEVQIVQKKLPQIEESLAERVVSLVQQLRKRKLAKTPGIAETLDWAVGLLALGYKTLDVEAVEKTLGCVLKSNDDLEMVKEKGVENLLEIE